MTGAGVPWWTPRVRGTLTTLLPLPDDTVYRDELEPCTLEVVDAHAGAANGVANGPHYGAGRVEYDVASALINYEEYHPFGTSAYRAVDSTIEVSPKRYRYAAAERDEETGLDSMGLRYYAPWLGRWTSADPIGLGDGVNRYAYVHGNPVSMRDPGGTSTEDIPILTDPQALEGKVWGGSDVGFRDPTPAEREAYAMEGVRKFRENADRIVRPPVRVSNLKASGTGDAGHGRQPNTDERGHLPRGPSHTSQRTFIESAAPVASMRIGSIPKGVFFVQRIRSGVDH
jgi:RHS repeat-associated protein